MFRKSIIISSRIRPGRCIHIFCKSNSIQQHCHTLEKSKILSTCIYSKRDFSSLDYFKKKFSINDKNKHTTKTNASYIAATTFIVSKENNLNTTAPEASVNSPLLGVTNASIKGEDKLADVASTSSFEYIPPPPPPPPPAIVEYIPPPTAIPEALVEATNAENFNAIGEATFSSLGLLTYSPVGLFLKTLETVHITTGLPWWGTIALVTVAVRLMVLPLVVKVMKNSIHFSNCMPVVKKLQDRAQEAKLAGDSMLAAQLSNELTTYMKKHNISYSKMFLQPLIQAPIFITMFLSLRRCAELPLESFTTGGLFWFTDLTLKDPYMILPAFCAITTFVTVKLGMETGISPAQGVVMKVLMYGMPLIIFPVTSRFPAALLCYWVTTNSITFVQSGVLRMNFVKKAFNMPERIIHPPDVTGQNKSIKDHIKKMKKTWNTQKQTAEVANRMRRDASNFEKAGTGPIPKTYAYNPTLVAKK